MSSVIRNMLKRSLTYVSTDKCSVFLFGLMLNSQVHYHIIPAPKFNETAPQALTADRVTLALTQKEMHKKEFEARNELDEDDARTLLTQIRSRL